MKIVTLNKVAQCADGESKKVAHIKKKTVTSWKFNTYWVRNHFVPNPTNPKLIRLKKDSKNNFLLKLNVEKFRTNEKSLWWSTESFQLTTASQLVSWSNNSTLLDYFVKKVVTFPFYIFLIFNLFNFEFVGFGMKWFLTQ